MTVPDGVEKNCCDGGLEEHRGVSSIVRWQQQITSEHRGTGGGDADFRLKDDNAPHTSFSYDSLRSFLKTS